MRITLESDYALRIVGELAGLDQVADAKTISERTFVTQKFALKILHKLVKGGIVTSHKGAKGGYELSRSPDKITLKQVIELIDGPIAIARCLGNAEACSMNSDKSSCIYHHIFDKISFEVAMKLEAITISDVLSKKYVI